MNKLFYKNKSPKEIVYYESFNKLNTFKDNTPEKYFNIVIITDGDSNKFKKCYESIIKQSYDKLNIFILFKNDFQISYVMTNTETTHYHLIPMFSTNDHIEYLSKHIRNDFHTIIIKESNMFVNMNCLKYINKHTNEINVLYWNNVNIDQDELKIGYCYENKLKHNLHLIDDNNIDNLLKHNIKILKQNIIIMKNI